MGGSVVACWLLRFERKEEGGFKAKEKGGGGKGRQTFSLNHPAVIFSLLRAFKRCYEVAGGGGGVVVGGGGGGSGSESGGSSKQHWSL